MDHAKAELEGINETIRQMEAYDQQMKSDIAVTRRETYGAEEAISKAEKAKIAQDLYIDRMSEDFKAKSEELALYESRLATQRAEAKQASSTLSEAVKEMEIIQSEKKQLLMQWQSTLVAISKRDEALQVWLCGHDFVVALQSMVPEPHGLFLMRARVLWLSVCVVSHNVPDIQATHAAVRKQQEEEAAMQADELGFKKCVVMFGRSR